MTFPLVIENNKEAPKGERERKEWPKGTSQGSSSQQSIVGGIPIEGEFIGAQEENEEEEDSCPNVHVRGWGGC